jgi:hypothetical protein
VPALYLEEIMQIVEYEQTLEDLVNVNLYYYKTSPLLKRTLMNRRIIFTLLILIFHFVIACGVTNGRTVNLSFVVMGFFFSVTYFFLQPWMVNNDIRNRTRKLFSEGSQQGLIGKQQVVFQEQGIQHETSTSIRTIQWSAIEQIVVTNDYIMLYESSISALAIPKRVFSNNSEMISLLDQIQHYIPNTPVIEIK